MRDGRLVPIRVALIQHGEKVRAPDDPGLTRAGRAQATAVAAVFRHTAVEAIYASPLRRSQETAFVIAAEHRLPVLTAAALSERMNWTLSSGLSLAGFLDEWARATTERDYVPLVGESSRAAATRMLGWLTGLLDRRNQLVVAVTHGGVTVDLLRTLLGDTELERRAPGLIDRGVTCGAITELLIGQDGEVTVERVAVTDHLAIRDPSIESGGSRFLASDLP